MPNYTTNYNLIKPLKEENYDVDEMINKNMDIIDATLYKKVEKITGKGLSTNDFTDGYKKKLDELDKDVLIEELKKYIDENYATASSTE